jgi:hypothetical protein
MDDTTPEMRELLRARFAALAPEERVRMCADMFESARALVLASLPAQADECTRRRMLCERFYGAELARKAGL